MSVCRCCGLPVVVPEVYRSIKLPRVKQRIFDIIAKRPGIPVDLLRDYVWVDDPDGGPESKSTIYVHIVQMNKILAEQGVRVVSREFGYYLQSIAGH